MQNSFNWMDLLIILILLIHIIDGMTKGLILSVFKTVGFFIAIYGARLIAPVVSQVISGNTGIYNSLNDYFHSTGESTIAPVLNLGKSSQQGSGGMLTSFLITIGAFIIAFLLIKLVLSIIAGTLNITAKLPVIKQFNKVGGLFFGLIKGLIVVYILFAVFILITPLISPSSILIEALNSSVIASYFYKNNLLLQWMNTLSIY